MGTRRRFPGGRVAGLGTLGVSALVVALLASAGASTAGTTLRAPFKAVTVSLANDAGTSGCGTSDELKHSHFSPKTGLGSWSSVAGAHSCAPQVGGVGTSSVGSAAGGFVVGVPFSVSASGWQGAVVTWAVAASVSLSLRPGSCSPLPGNSYSCYAETEASASGSVEIVYASNGTLVAPGNNSWIYYSYDYNSTYCSSGKCYYGSSSYTSGAFGVLSLYVNGTLLANTSYALVTGISTAIYTYCSDSNAVQRSCHAGATFNMATLGNGAVLRQIVVS